jgi:hypothetical protein
MQKISTGADRTSPCDGGSGGEPAQLEMLQQRFAQFRAEGGGHKRIPASLRAAVVAALEQGVPPGALQRVCHLSGRQMAAWQASARATAGFAPPVRVFSVVDEPPNHPRAVRELSLRVGSWSVTVRLSHAREGAKGAACCR